MVERVSPSAVVPDWGREAPRRWWDPSRRLLRAVRRWQAARDRGGPVGAVLRRWWTLQHRFWSVVTGAEVQLGTEIAGGLILQHPQGVVIHPASRIGPNCLMMQGVTLGGGGGVPPVLEGHVDVGPGAKILGGVRIGRHVLIGANAVVTKDVPSGSVAMGVPARVTGTVWGRPGWPAGPEED